VDITEQDDGKRIINYETTIGGSQL
jgi:hypothetical protein